MEHVYTSKNYEDTQNIAYQIGIRMTEPMVILLSGDLGSGKTTFTQGLAKGIGVTKTISSPTFTIMKNYNGRFQLNHIDAYRLESLHQDLGFEELIGAVGITVIEWPDYLEELFPEEYLRIDILRVSKNRRKLVFTPKGTKYEKLIEDLI